MHARLVGQAGPGVVALDEVSGFVESPVVGLALLDDLELPAAQGGVALVHLGEVPGEEIGLLATLRTADLEDDVAALVGVPRQQQRLEFLIETRELGLGVREFLTPEFAVVAGALGEHLARRRDVLAGATHLGPDVHDLRELFVTTREVPQATHVGSDVGAGEVLLDGTEFVLEGIESVVERAHGVTPGLGLGRATLALLRVAALEALDATTGVHQLLLTGEERVARVAEFDLDLGLGGTLG